MFDGITRKQDGTSVIRARKEREAINHIDSIAFHLFKGLKKKN